MLLSTILISALTLALAPSTVFCLPANASSPEPCAEKAIAAAWHDAIINSYLDFWNGDLGLAQQIFSPNVTVWQDRVPGVNGSEPYPIFDVDAYVEWARLSRDGWEPWTIINRYGFGVDNRVVIRWTLEAVLQDPAGSVPGM